MKYIQLSRSNLLKTAAAIAAVLTFAQYSMAAKTSAQTQPACASTNVVCDGDQQAKQDRVALKENDRIVFLGDSITAAGPKPGGYITLASEAIAKAYPDLNIKLIGAGKGGHKVPNCQKRLDRDVLQKNPTIVFIYIGINDVWHWTHPKVIARGRTGTTPEDFESGLRDMIAKINDVGARVILCTPTVIGEKHDGTNPDDVKLDQYSDISRKVAKDTGSQLLDLRREIIAYLQANNPQNLDSGILTDDTVHMNAAGNRFLAQQVLEALNVPVANSGK